MNNIRSRVGIVFTTMTACGLLTFGCSSSSEETTKLAVPLEPTATELLQTQVKDLQSSNDSLKQEITGFEVRARGSAERIAQLDSQLVDLRQQLAAVPAAPPRPTPRSTPNFSSAREGYNEGLRLFRSRNYQEAAGAFQTILDGGVPKELQDNCIYWLGECSYAMKQYGQAIEDFQKVFAYQISEKKDESQLMIANSYLAMGKKTDAKTALERLVEKFPASPYIKGAKTKLEKL